MVDETFSFFCQLSNRGGAGGRRRGGGGGGGGYLGHRTSVASIREQVWPSGKGVRLVSGRTSVDTASALLSFHKGCDLWTLSCDFVHHFLPKH